MDSLGMRLYICILIAYLLLLEYFEATRSLVKCSLHTPSQVLQDHIQGYSRHHSSSLRVLGLKD
jgi:hypothetical protein